MNGTYTVRKADSNIMIRETWDMETQQHNDNK